MAKIKIDCTEKELAALIEILDEFHAGLGAGEDDEYREKLIRKTGNMLKKNGIKTTYNSK